MSDKELTKKTDKVQAVLFDNKKFNAAKARRWLTKHNYHPIKRMHRTEDKLRYRMKDPKRFDKFRTLKLGKDTGIELILGFK